MIVSFDPYINNTANQDATYANFLRCVTAIATAAAGTTSLTVNPYLTVSTVDGTKNCITGIIANTEGGGWLTSPTTHSIPSYPSTFTQMASKAAYSTMYKADFYNENGKASMPYNKMTFHAVGHNQTNANDAIWNGRIATAPLTGWTTSGVGGQLQMTFGCSTSTDGDSNYTPSWSTATPNQQSNSWTNNAYFSNTTGSATSGNNWPGNATGFNLSNIASVTYTMAVTANYCIIWEVHRSNSYANGYSNTYSFPNGGSCYGAIMYGGMRTTQPWEDTLSNNPPWVAWNVTHVPAGTQGIGYGAIDGTLNPYNPTTNYGSWPYTAPQPPNSAAAFMYTTNDSGIVSASPSRYANFPFYQWFKNNINTSHCAVSGTGYQTAAGRLDSFSYTQQSGTTDPLSLSTPLFHQRQRKSQNINSISSTTHNPNLPTVDSDTGTFVPGAYPVKIARHTSGTWNSGGICKGIYKSLTMPLANMKLYWQDGQTFTINGEPYTPIVFNEDMYLIRKA